MMRAVQLLAGVLILGAIVLAIGWIDARADPMVRRTALAMPDWPAGAAPVTVALMSDIHIGNAAMDVERFDRIVAQVNALSPDLVLIAGDFIDGHEAGRAARLAPLLTAPLARLRAPLGVVAVPGNHDHWTGLGAVAAALNQADVALLANTAIVRGPLAIGGVDDDFSGHADVTGTAQAVRALPGAKVLVTHSPDVAPALPTDMTVLLAGHTHCGQAVIPGWGPVQDVSRYGPRYRCGLVREGARRVVVTGGMGASVAPLRYGAPPDLWLIRLGPAA